jgi:hypothetical protein
MLLSTCKQHWLCTGRFSLRITQLMHPADALPCGKVQPSTCSHTARRQAAQQGSRTQHAGAAHSSGSPLASAASTAPAPHATAAAWGCPSKRLAAVAVHRSQRPHLQAAWHQDTHAAASGQQHAPSGTPPNTSVCQRQHCSWNAHASASHSGGHRHAQSCHSNDTQARMEPEEPWR